MMQRAETRMQFRIGIHVGDAIVESEDMLGDGVNVAARLEGLAEPGGVCASARVHEDVTGLPAARLLRRRGSQGRAAERLAD
jgi:class 3 adenylate cyclase